MGCKSPKWRNKSDPNRYRKVVGKYERRQWNSIILQEGLFACLEGILNWNIEKDRGCEGEEKISGFNEKIRKCQNSLSTFELEKRSKKKISNGSDRKIWAS